MKILLGLKIGGLQQKILNLVLIFLLALIGVFTAVAMYQLRALNTIVTDASQEQQQAIDKVSGETMYAAVEQSMTKTNAMQAYIADDMFRSVGNDVTTLQMLAESIFEDKDSYEPREVYPPDPAKDGVMDVAVMWEDGVDYTKSEYIPLAAHMADTMKAIYSSATYSSNVYISFEDGTYLEVDTAWGNKFDENGELMTFGSRQRPWYREAAETRRMVFSDVYEDEYTGTVCVTCSAPVYAYDELVGVVGIDIFDRIRNCDNMLCFILVDVVDDS